MRGDLRINLEEAIAGGGTGRRLGHAILQAVSVWERSNREHIRRKTHLPAAHSRQHYAGCCGRPESRCGLRGSRLGFWGLCKELICGKKRTGIDGSGIRAPPAGKRLPYFSPTIITTTSTRIRWELVAVVCCVPVCDQFEPNFDV